VARRVPVVSRRHMRRPWLAYLLTALAACGVGVAIAGLPDGLPGDDPVATVDVVAVTVITAAPPSTASPSTTVLASTVAPSTTGAPATTVPSTTTTTTTTTTSTTTTITTTTTVVAPDTTTSTTVPPSPADARVAVANGAGVPGIAGDAAELLADAGFDDVTATDAEPVDVTTVYYADGFEAIADLVAVELFIDPDAQAPMSDLPELATDEEFAVVAVLGADVGP